MGHLGPVPWVSHLARFYCILYLYLAGEACQSGPEPFSCKWDGCYGPVANHSWGGCPYSRFIEQMDQLFNCFNSMSLSSTANMRHAMTASSGHKEHLQKSLEWIKRIKTKEKKSPPCLEGWQISINALMMLWDKLHSEHDFRFLLTNRLNQDYVENLFSIIRAQGAQRDNPDAGQFRAAFRQVMVDMVMIPSKGGNCEEDVDKFICTLENIQINTTQFGTYTRRTFNYGYNPIEC